MSALALIGLLLLGLASLGLVALLLYLAWRFDPGRRARRQFDDEMSRREPLTDEQYYERFFAHSGVPRDIPLRLRTLYAKYVRFPAALILPSDELTHLACDSLDVMELVWDIERAFGVRLTNEELATLDGSMYSIVACLIAKGVHTEPVAPHQFGEPQSAVKGP
jgi:hypothetical protein